MNTIGIVGTGYVADLYMRSFETFPHVRVLGAFDRNPEQLSRFCRYWNISPAQNLSDFANGAASPSLILNLTNPTSHFEVSEYFLRAGKHVYSEKPLAMTMDQAQQLARLAEQNSLILASAPCSLLGEAAQTLWAAVRSGIAGKTLLVYAELDDDFVVQAPFDKWQSESGANWPHEDEFSVGCTLEHAGYYLTWLIAMFGSVKRVVSASALLTTSAFARPAPDYTSATLYFSSGVVARLTCSIVAPHNHTIRLVGEKGVLEADQCWDNDAKIRFRRRFVVRRRLLNSPIARRLKLPAPTHPKVAKRGSARMNFALGPAEILAALAENRPCRLSRELALHLNEVTLAIQSGGISEMCTDCPPLEPMPWAEKLN